MEDLINPDEKILCPYNNAHHIRRCRMPFHLVKCRKNHPNANMGTCDFNINHVIPLSELRYHHQECPDRRKVEPQVVELNPHSSSLSKFPIAKYEVQSDENWDDINVVTYNPKAAAENRNIIRHMDVESSSKRKQFRLSERARLGGLSRNVTTTLPSTTEEYVQLPRHRVVSKISTEELPPHLSEQQKRCEDKVYLQYKS